MDSGLIDAAHARSTTLPFAISLAITANIASAVKLSSCRAFQRSVNVLGATNSSLFQKRLSIAVSLPSILKASENNLRTTSGCRERKRSSCEWSHNFTLGFGWDVCHALTQSLVGFEN